MTDGFIVVPTTKFFADNIGLINEITSFVKDVIAPIFIIYFTFVFLRTYFGGNISDLPMSLWRFFFIGLMILYFYPLFTASYNGFSSVGNGIFNLKDLEYLNMIDQKLQSYAANPDAPDTPHEFSILGTKGVGSILHARGLEYWFLRLLFFIAHVAYTAVFFLRQVLLLLSISVLPYLLIFSFWESAKNRAIGLVTMIVEILFWYPVLCICLRIIFPLNETTGGSNWLRGTAVGLSGFFEEKGPSYMLGEIMFRIALVIVATLITPMITYMIFNGRAVYAAGLAASPLYSASRMVSHQVTRLSNAVMSKSTGKSALKATGSVVNYAGNTLRTAAQNTAAFVKQPSAGGAAKIALSPIQSLKYSFPSTSNNDKKG